MCCPQTTTTASTITSMLLVVLMVLVVVDMIVVELKLRCGQKESVIRSSSSSSSEIGCEVKTCTEKRKTVIHKSRSFSRYRVSSGEGGSIVVDCGWYGYHDD